MKKLFSSLAAAAVLAAPISASAQGFNEAMDALIANAGRKIDVSRPGDDKLTCDQIRMELAEHSQSLANMMGRVTKIADNQMKANEVERKALTAAAAARDIANMSAPANTAPGNAIYDAAKAAADAAQKAREVKTLGEMAVRTTDAQFSSQRIPYLHELASGKCGSEPAE